MTCVALLFAVILTVSKVTSLQCSDQQLLASGDDHLQQVTTLAYNTAWLIDDCTIMKIDTGEKLDIVYTTDSLIITTARDGHTSEVIAKKQNELLCYDMAANNQTGYYFIPPFVLSSLLVLVLSGYICGLNYCLKSDITCLASC